MTRAGIGDTRRQAIIEIELRRERQVHIDREVDGAFAGRDASVTGVTPIELK
jgi:hypothetical protein